MKKMIVFTILAATLLSCRSVEVLHYTEDRSIHPTSKYAFMLFHFEGVEGKKNEGKEFFRRALYGELSECGCEIIKNGIVISAIKEEYAREKDRETDIFKFMSKVGRTAGADIAITGEGRVSYSSGNEYLDRVKIVLFNTRDGSFISEYSYKTVSTSVLDVAKLIGGKMCEDLKKHSLPVR